MRVLRASETSTVRRMCRGATPDHHGHPRKVEQNCSLLHSVLQDALSGLTKIYPHLTLGVFLDDTTAFLSGRNEELVEMAEKALKKVKREVEEKGLMLSITEGGKERKSKTIASCKYLEVSGMQQKRSCFGDEC